MNSAFKFCIWGFVFSLLLISCKKKAQGNVESDSLDTQLAEPKACFTASDLFIQPAEAVDFQNCSENCNKISWDFGDGIISEENSPTHTYQTKGLFKVTATAYNGNKSHQYTQTIACGMKAFVTLTVNFSEWDTTVSPFPNNQMIYVDIGLFKNSYPLVPLSQPSFLLKNYASVGDLIATAKLPDENTDYQIRIRAYYVKQYAQGNADFVEIHDLIDLSTQNIRVSQKNLRSTDFFQNKLCRLDYKLSEIEYN